MRYFLLAVLAVTLMACRESAAPEAPCVPNFDNPDSSKVIPSTSGADTAYVIRIAWCGPITVE